MGNYCSLQTSNATVTVDYLIVGGGNAAGYACQEFVAQGLADKVAVICEEAHVPYERPALTKAYLHHPGAKVRARLPGFHTCVGTGGERQTPEWYTEKKILIINDKATKLDAASKMVETEKGERVSYKKLIIATGSRALRVSRFGVKGDEAPGAFYLRSEADAASLVKHLEHLGSAAKVVIVGGGYIGLECAAALVGWKIDVTMVFPEAHVMSRLFTPELAKWMEEEYTKRGIKLLREDSVSEILNKDGKVSGAKLLKSGTTLDCNTIVIGVGGVLNIEWCNSANLKTEKGAIAVDAFMQTSDPDIFAVGDVCCFPSRSGSNDRCEHVDHARKSAIQAVKAASGKSPAPYDYLPYFYSRIFEYSDSPIVFNFFGLQAGQCKVFSRGKSLGAVWEADGKVKGCLIIGSPGPSADDATKLKELALRQPPAGDPAAIFAAAGL